MFFLGKVALQTKEKPGNFYPESAITGARNSRSGLEDIESIALVENYNF